MITTLEHRARGLHQLLLLGQIAILVAFFWLWHALWLQFYQGEIVVQHYPLYCAMMALGLFLEAQNRGWDVAGLFEKSLLKRLPLTLRQLVFALGTLLIFLVVAKDRLISRAFLLTMLPGLYLALLAGNQILPRLLSRLLFRGPRQGRILLVGDALRAKKLRDWLRAKSEFGFVVAGILCENKPEVRGQMPMFDGLPVLGAPSDLDCMIAEHSITHVILLDNPGSPGFDPNLIHTVHEQGARLLVLSDVDEWFHHPVTIVEEEGLKFFTFYSEPLENPLNRTLKRTLDLFVAAFAVIFILPPVCALVWILQRLHSPGPLFHKQQRAGIQNRVFTLFKFRTMHVGGHAETLAASRNDARVFKSARWLRRFSIDELPQFLNVLRGEMSVVGPRPHLLAHNDEFARVMRNYHVRAFVKPGITGLAQVRGLRGEAKSFDAIAARLQSDMVYLENWSLLLDVAIILRTIWQMFFPPPTAY